MQQCVYQAKICDICDLQKCLKQTWVDSEQKLLRLQLTGSSFMAHGVLLPFYSH